MTTRLSASPSSLMPPSATVRRTVRAVLLAWGTLALGVSVSGVLESLPPLVFPVLIWSGPLAFLALRARSNAFREYLLGLDLRPLVLFHLVRAVAGVGFLVLHQRGQLPGDLALYAGWGDIAVGLTAPLALLALPAHTPARQRWGLLWNVLGLLDILGVIVSAQRLLFFSGTPDALAPLTRFPFSLLPLFIVPLVFITHFTMMARLWAGSGLSGRSGPWARR
ncbi:MAG TPA: hypothetical protein VEU33_07445 [Archangium sp.]|nr:hypothetical protein [Archangium sp.]